jgi:hypothetical protein
MRWTLQYEGVTWSWRYLPAPRPFGYVLEGTKQKWTVGQVVGPFGLLSWKRNNMLIPHEDRTLRLGRA